MRKILIFLSVITITIFGSCTMPYRYIYTATPPNNPYFIEKGESKLAGYYSGAWHGGDPSQRRSGGWDLQGAYAIGNHWAVTAGYLNRNEIDGYRYNDGDNNPQGPYLHYKRNLFDIGTGYFVALDKKKVATFNLYGGVALGKFSFADEDYDKFHKSSITKTYFQPSLNYMPTPNIRLSFGSRLSFVHYGNIQTSYTQYEIEELSLNLINNQTITYIEPAFNMQFGLREFPGAKLDFTISGTTRPFSDERILLFSRTSNVSIGFSFDLSKMTKKE